MNLLYFYLLLLYNVTKYTCFNPSDHSLRTLMILPSFLCPVVPKF